MKTLQFTSATTPSPDTMSLHPDLVLVFGVPEALMEPTWLGRIKQLFPSASVFGCSTAGQIRNTAVLDDEIVFTAIRMEHSKLLSTRVALGPSDDGTEAGQRLGKSLPADGLRHVMVLSEGVHINGSRLVQGLQDSLPKGVSITGGLSGDGPHFRKTLVVLNDGPEQGIVGAIGLYGDRLRVGYGSYGGWDPFGPERVITRSEGNVLYEMDGKSALALYKRYLGDHANRLPAAGLLFPLSIRTDRQTPVVRTLLGVDEAKQSMVFAGEMPQGAYARLMNANFDRLIDGATEAARTTSGILAMHSAQLAILISCVGRRLILKQRIEEEVEAVRDVLGPQPAITGFYSYGEISPFGSDGPCELHNQTMTVTALSES